MAGEGAGPEGAPLSLPHMSFDVIQAEGHAFVRAAPFGLLLALPSSAQFVLNDLGRRWGGKWVAQLEPRPPGPTPAPRPRSAHLVGVVKELQHREDAGPDEQPHLAPNVTCRGAQQGQWDQDTVGAAELPGTGAGKSYLRKNGQPWYRRSTK